VCTLPCNGGSFQKWIELPGRFGGVVLQNLATGFVLDSNHARQVYTHVINGGSYQTWLFW
jgi:serine/threonine-protein kinase